MAMPGFVSKGDFVTMLLQNDLFKDNEEYMVDECLTFMLASTGTNTLLATNMFYHMTKSSDKKKKLRDEINVSARGDMSDSDWIKFLLEDQVINTCNYLSYCVNETLRIDPSLRHSTRMQLNEAIELGGKKILKNQEF